MFARLLIRLVTTKDVPLNLGAANVENHTPFPSISRVASQYTVSKLVRPISQNGPVVSQLSLVDT
jgi:hypothetical protein